MKLFFFTSLFFLLLAAVATFSFFTTTTDAFKLHQHQQHFVRNKSPNPAQKARVYMSYCPSLYTISIAVVEVSVTTGAWNILGTAPLPFGVFSCNADYSPTFAADPHNPDILWMDFATVTDYFVSIEVKKSDDPSSQNQTQVVIGSVFKSLSPMFTGFQTFNVRDSEKVLEGITTTVTETGFCSEGCIGYGIQNFSGNREGSSSPLPFGYVAVGATSFFDKANNRFYVQGYNDLRATPCAPNPDQTCLLAIDTTNGQLLTSTNSRDTTVYRFGYQHTSGSSSLVVSAFVSANCNRSDQASMFAFARVNLPEAQFEIVSCAPANVVLDAGPWINAFSPDNEVFCTTSESGNGADPQFATYDVANGNAIIQTKLSGLLKKLNAQMRPVAVWALTLPPL